MNTDSFHSVIPAQAGIQVELLDPRMREDDNTEYSGPTQSVGEFF